MISIRVLLLVCTFYGTQSTPIGSLPNPIPDINSQVSGNNGFNFDVGNINVNGGLGLNAHLQVTNNDASARRSDPIHIVAPDPNQPVDAAPVANEPSGFSPSDFSNNLVMIPTSILQGFNQAGGSTALNPLRDAVAPISNAANPFSNALSNPLPTNPFPTAEAIGAGAAKILAAKATLAAPFVAIGSTLAAPFVTLGATAAALVVKGGAIIGAKILTGAALKAAIISKGAALGSAILGKKALLLGGISSGAAAVSTGLASAAGAPFVLLPASVTAGIAGLGALASPILAPLSLFNGLLPNQPQSNDLPEKNGPVQVFVVKQTADGKTVLIPVEIDASQLPPVDPTHVFHLKIDHPGLGLNVDTAAPLPVHAQDSSTTVFNVGTPVASVKGDTGPLGTNVLVNTIGSTVDVNTLTNEIPTSNRNSQGFRAF